MFWFLILIWRITIPWVLVVGLISAFFYALRNISSKKLVGRCGGDAVLINQLIVAGIFLFPTLFVGEYKVGQEDLVWLLILGLFTTALGHTLFLVSLKKLSTSTASILASLQPAYAIILAVLLIDEELTNSVLLGGAIILSAVLLQTFYSTSNSGSTTSD